MGPFDKEVWSRELLSSLRKRWMVFRWWDPRYWYYRLRALGGQSRA
jgi:hypothetical protein